MDFDDDPEDWYDDHAEVRCKHCRERDLHWEEARDEHNEKRWVLLDFAGNVHRCPAFPLAPGAEEFDDFD